MRDTRSEIRFRYPVSPNEVITEQTQP